MTEKEIIEKIEETKKFFMEIESYENRYNIAECEREIVAMCEELIELKNEEKNTYQRTWKNYLTGLTFMYGLVTVNELFLIKNFLCSCPCKIVGENRAIWGTTNPKGQEHKEFFFLSFSEQSVVTAQYTLPDCASGKRETAQTTGAGAR